MSSERPTFEVTVSDALVEFVDRVYRSEIEDAGAYKPFPMGADGEGTELNPAEQALSVLMTTHRDVVFSVRQDRGLLDQNEVEEELTEDGEPIRALRLPSDLEQTRKLQVARITIDD